MFRKGLVQPPPRKKIGCLGYVRDERLPSYIYIYFINQYKDPKKNIPIWRSKSLPFFGRQARCPAAAGGGGNRATANPKLGEAEDLLRWKWLKFLKFPLIHGIHGTGMFNYMNGWFLW